uniref:GG11573 n=1 Tax=Drosophila erecta TaxID=7220 RepID=B3P5X8_DROER
MAITFSAANNDDDLDELEELEELEDAKEWDLDAEATATATAKAFTCYPDMRTYGHRDIRTSGHPDVIRTSGYGHCTFAGQSIRLRLPDVDNAAPPGAATPWLSALQLTIKHAVPLSRLSITEQRCL